jgi:hypothetical protein
MVVEGGLETFPIGEIGDLSDYLELLGLLEWDLNDLSRVLDFDGTEVFGGISDRLVAEDFLGLEDSELDCIALGRLPEVESEVPSRVLGIVNKGGLWCLHLEFLIVLSNLLNEYI